MRVWVDADACPGPIKDLILRAALRLGLPLVFVANKTIGIPESIYVTTVRVAKDPEAVDEYITLHAEASDLVITQDIPLASLLVPKGIAVMSPRGEVFTAENVGERLSIRNFMHDAREAGVVTPGPRPFGLKDRQRFADALDRELTRRLKRNPRE